MGNRDMKTFLKMLKDDSGASAAEYALILAIVGTAIAAAAILLGESISGAMSNATACIDSGGDNCPTGGGAEEPPVDPPVA